MAKYVCPQCGGTHFGVTAHVTQDWVVGSDGDFEKCTQECVEVTHRPDDEDVWSCTSCGYEAAGAAFRQEDQ